MITLFITLMFFHWLFDFMLQPREFADNKWNNIWFLLGHVGIYGIGMFFVVTCPALGLVRSMGVLYFVGLNILAHAFVDFFTSKINHMYYESKQYYKFFGMIGFDQFVHVAILLYTAQLYLHFPEVIQ